MLKTEQTSQSVTVNAANSAADERPFSAARRLKTCPRSTIMKREKSREQTNFAFLANEFVGYNDHRKRTVSTLIMILSNPISHDTQPLFLSLLSIVPTGAVILFVVFVTMFRKGSGL